MAMNMLTGKNEDIKWDDQRTMEKIRTSDILTPDNRIFGKKEIDPSKWFIILKYLI